MSMLVISFMIIIVNLAITMLFMNFFIDAVLERFKIEYDIDNLFKDHISRIYDIIKFNGLARPAKKDKEAE